MREQIRSMVILDKMDWEMWFKYVILFGDQKCD